MITIIHGSDIAKSRNYYLELRQKAREHTVLYGEKLTEIDVLQAFSGNDLFGTEKAVFIEELFSKRKPSKDLDTVILSISNSQSPITLWESKDLTAKQTSQFKNAQIKHFKIPTIVFTFVDSLLPKNGKRLVTLFHDLLRDEDAIYALSMLQRQIRLLLAVYASSPPVKAKSNLAKIETKAKGQDPGSKYTVTKDISELGRLAPWQVDKLAKQANLFGLDLLIDLHSKLYEIELGQKTGTLSLSLDQAIDFLLLSL